MFLHDEFSNIVEGNMTLVQRTVFYHLVEHYNVYLTGSYRYGAQNNESDFDFFISMNEINTESDFDSYIGSLDRYEKESASSYNGKGTGQYFGPFVYKMKCGIDIQVVHGHRIDTKLYVDDVISHLCYNFNIPKGSRKRIMTEIIKDDAWHEAEVEKEILGW